jgi:ArsR family transcriptional regulator, arsenate/arsenite/antimonite-responsive transcriptional repressor
MGDVFKALASEPRRRMLNHLAGGPMTVGEIAEKFEMELPSISKHLAVLREAGLIRQQKRGQFILYSLAADHVANTLYGFLSPFCPDARRIARERKAAERAAKKRPGAA